MSDMSQARKEGARAPDSRPYLSPELHIHAPISSQLLPSLPSQKPEMWHFGSFGLLWNLLLFFAV